MCHRSVSAIYRSDRRASRSSAAPVLRLWRALDYPQPANLTAHIEEVVEAIDAGYKPLAYLRDIDGIDYSRKVATVLKVSGWADKVEALEGYRPARPLTASEAWAVVLTKRRTTDGVPRNGIGVYYWRFCPDDHAADDRIFAALTAVGGWDAVTTDQRAAFVAAWERQT